jgi:SAM-dependent methyltransferase
MSIDETPGPNAAQVEHWNRVEAGHWVEAQDRYDAMLRPLGRRAIDALALQPGERVLDIGCGCGDTTLEVAERLGPTGHVRGVDLSAPMLDRAAGRARERGLAQIAFEQADAQVDPLGPGSYDAAVSRFGVMFFDDPVAAFANITAALRPGGRLAFVCWQEMARNEWMLVPGAAVVAHVPLPDLGPPGAPGEFAFADPSHVRTVLERSGLAEVVIDALDDPVTVAGYGTVDEAVRFLSDGNIGRTLFADAAPEVVAAAIADVRAALAPYETPEGVRLGAAAWLVTARKPDGSDGSDG